MKKRVIRLTKSSSYELQWRELQFEFERGNLDDEEWLRELKVKCSQALRSAIEDGQEYWTLDRPQPFHADANSGRLFVQTKSERWYTIAEQTVQDALLGILIQESDNVKHHTPML